MGSGQPTAIFGITMPLLIGLVAAVLSGMALAALHAWLAISVRADQIISGVIINIAAIGLTGYLNTLISGASPRGAGGFKPLDVPPQVAEIPLVGWLINAIFDQGPIAIGAIILVFVLQILLFRTRWGLRLRASGEKPSAAGTVGIDVISIRYRAMLMAGLMAGIGGSALSLASAGSFQMGMSAGKGFIALAAVIFGAWNPVYAFGAALVFGFADSAQALLSILGVDVPPQLLNSVPYIVTIIVVAGVVGRVRGPAAVAQPYDQG
jgi:simple sugar transport system permease protein